MGVLLSCQDVSKSFGTRNLFSSLSFGLNEGECTGLIGPNGSGKSTLLKIIAGEDTPDTGSITAKKRIRIAYLPQTEDLSSIPENTTVIQYLSSYILTKGYSEQEASTISRIGLDKARFADVNQLVKVLSG